MVKNKFKGLLTDKQYDVFDCYVNHPFKMMILVGAVRAGKTYIDNIIFVNELKRVQKLAKKRHDVHPIYILAGATAGSIRNNVITELERQFPQLGAIKPDKNGHLHLFGVDIVQVYTSKSDGIARARGFTSYGAYINEASLCVHSIFDEIQNRCSIENSRIICDSNPDIPTHWLKTDYIDNHDPKAGIVSYTFTIDDNSFLAKDYVTALKASKPRGVFYDRDILGMWATGAGMVYSAFDKSTMVIADDEVPSDLTYYCGVDWGFAKGHSNVITLWGDDDKGTHYLVECYQSEGEYIDHWIEVARNIMKRYGYGIPFYCDSARPEYVKSFRDAGISSYNGDKRVMAGIQYVSEEIKKNKVKIAQSASKDWCDDVYQYQWDKVKGVPVKDHDNVMDSSRYALFTYHKKATSTAMRNFLA